MSTKNLLSFVKAVGTLKLSGVQQRRVLLAHLKATTKKKVNPEPKKKAPFLLPEVEPV